MHKILYIGQLFLKKEYICSQIKDLTYKYTIILCNVYSYSMISINIILDPESSKLTMINGEWYYSIQCVTVFGYDVCGRRIGDCYRTRDRC